MTRRRKIILAFLLALSAGCLAMGVRSYWRNDRIYGPAFVLISDHGGLCLRIDNLGWYALRYRSFQSNTNGEGFWLGFSVGYDQLPEPYEFRYAWFGLPWWLLAMIPAFFAWRLRRKW